MLDNGVMDDLLESLPYKYSIKKKVVLNQAKSFCTKNLLSQYMYLIGPAKIGHIGTKYTISVNKSYMYFRTIIKYFDSVT